MTIILRLLQLLIMILGGSAAAFAGHLYWSHDLGLCLDGCLEGINTLAFVLAVGGAALCFSIAWFLHRRAARS